MCYTVRKDPCSSDNLSLIAIIYGIETVEESKGISALTSSMYLHAVSMACVWASDPSCWVWIIADGAGILCFCENVGDL